MFSAAQQLAGTDVRIDTVTGIELSPDKSCVAGVKLGDVTLPCDIVVIAMGPWTSQAQKWLKVPKIESRRAHSIVVQPSEPVSAHALFVSYNTTRGRVRDPEVYPRPDGEVYMCGMSDLEPLPASPADVVANKESCQTLKNIADKISSNLAGGSVRANQACYLPSSSDGLPVIGQIPGLQGAYIATGHSCWGILNAPATGAALT